MEVKYAKLPQNMPNGGKVRQMNLKRNRMAVKIPKFSIPRHTKINLIWDYLVSKKPSGNPGANKKFRARFFTLYSAWLPDFSWYIKPKWERNIPKGQ
jgi:hypothetical protein